MKKTILMAVLAALVLIVPPLPQAFAQPPSVPVAPEVTQAEAYFATLIPVRP
jgi:hypothetical protein